MTITESIHHQNSRGDFAYWPVQAEAQWKAANVPQPESPDLKLRDKYGFPHGFAEVRPNSYAAIESEYRKWDKAIEGGKDYMVGDSQDMETFIRTHRSALTAWQKIAYAWATANPFYKLDVRIGRNEWSIYQRGEYVDFYLPHHDAGGEKSYISRDGKTKVLINVD